MSRFKSRRRSARRLTLSSILAVFIAAVIGLMTGVAPASAATQFGYWDTAPVVNGTSVSFDSYIGASQKTTVRNLAICVRDQNGANYDLPPVNNGGSVTIKANPTGYSLTSTGTFQPGTYTFGTCFQPTNSNTWYGSLGQSNIANFTVAETTVPGGSDDTVAPVGDVAGFNQIWAENFDTDAAAGTVGTSAAYADRFNLTPDGQRGTDNVGVYENSRNLSVHDGTLDLTERASADGTDTSGAQLWFLNDKNGAWAYTGGRFSLRMKAEFNIDTVYGVCNLLWPVNNVWNEGELDYPEGSLGGEALLNQHMMAPNDPSQVNLTRGLVDGFQQWHTWTIDWKPGQSITYYLDGVQFAQETNPSNIPTSEHAWVLQALNVADEDIPADAVAHVYVDWATAYALAS